MLEALITRSRLHRVQALLPSCGSNHDAFNRAPPGTALTLEGGQGGRGGRSRGHPASRGGSSGQLATGHPLKRHFASFTSSFLLFHPPLALKSHPQPATPRRICARVPNRPPTVWRIPPTSTTSNSHRLTSRAITPGVARSRPSRSLHFFFSSLSPLRRLLGSRLRSKSPPRWVFGKPCPPALPAAPCPSTSTFVRVCVCASRCCKGHRASIGNPFQKC